MSLHTERRITYVTTATCDKCGRVQDFEVPDIPNAVFHAARGLNRMGWTWIDEFIVRCPECTKEQHEAE